MILEDLLCFCGELNYGAPTCAPDTGHQFGVLLLLVNVLEDVFEAAVVGFQDGVLGAHVQRPLLLDGVLEAAVSESPDRLHKKKRKSQKLRFSP